MIESTFTQNERGLSAEYAQPALDWWEQGSGGGGGSDANNPGGGINYSNGLPDYSLYNTSPTSTSNPPTDTMNQMSPDTMADLLTRLFSEPVYISAQNPQSDVAVVPTQTASSGASVLPILIMAGGAALVAWWYYKKHAKGGD